MIVALVKYKEWINPPHTLLDGKFRRRSKVVSVNRLVELGDVSDNITSIQILSRDIGDGPAVQVSDESNVGEIERLLLDFCKHDSVQSIVATTAMSIEQLVKEYIADMYEVPNINY